MDAWRHNFVKRFPGAQEFVTVKAQALSFKKARPGRLHNKNDHGLGIAFASDADPESETLEAGREYEINLHFVSQALDEALEPFISRQAGLFVFTFLGLCKHVTTNAENALIAGFEILGDIPTPVQEFLMKCIPADRTPAAQGSPAPRSL
jgi:hypothetical protein